MDQATWLATLKRHRAIALLRAPTFNTGVAMAKAAVEGGFGLIEVAWTSHEAATLVDHLRQFLPADCWVGAGTVLTPDAAKAAIAAGVQFCFSPHTDANLIELCQHHAIPVIPGALTPTEIVNAWQLGASSVKVFPCESMGGAAYLRHLQAPLPHIPLIPCGGVTVAAARAYLDAGAIAIGVSSSLFPQSLVAAKNWEAITERSRHLLQQLHRVQDLGHKV
jgi:2-dehydro-3-deoxyphosphogluconate aldolase/(4S)-4-hydroxy-2-oxoglutarate aldolase